MVTYKPISAQYPTVLCIPLFSTEYAFFYFMMNCETKQWLHNNFENGYIASAKSNHFEEGLDTSLLLF